MMDAPDSRLTLLLASCLPSDHWISMQGYVRQLLAGLGRYESALAVRRVLPVGARWDARCARACVRRFLYPLAVRQAVRAAPRPAVLHVTDQFYAYLASDGVPCVVTCHDIADYKYSDLSAAQLRRWKRRVARLRNARGVFVDSANTARDVEQVLEIPARNILVNPLGVDPDFRVLPEGQRAVSPAVRALAERARTEILALHVGSNLQRKNIGTLLKAVAALRAEGRPVTLVKVGDSLLSDRTAIKARDLGRAWDARYAGLIRDLGIEAAILDMGKLSREELVAVYNVCSVFLFPSLYEGFGFPVLEAMACGLPCVVSNASSLPELGGEAVLYHHPERVDDLVGTVRRVLDDAALRARLVAQGRSRAAVFTWEAHVERLVQGYGRVARGETLS